MASSETLKGSSSPTCRAYPLAFKRPNLRWSIRSFETLRRVPVIRFRYDTPDQRGFSFCSVAIKSRKQFAARNSLKGDGRTSVRAILFNDGTLKRRGHLIDFRHELRQIPLPSVVNTFSSAIFRPPISEPFSSVPKSFFGTHTMLLLP